MRTELFGNYFHSGKRLKPNDWRRTELGRIMAFNSVGWQCLVIWESELSDTGKVVRKIIGFMGAKHE